MHDTIIITLFGITRRLGCRRNKYIYWGFVHTVESFIGQHSNSNQIVPVEFNKDHWTDDNAFMLLSWEEKRCYGHLHCAISG